MASPVHITEAEFESKVLKSPVPVLVDFWAEWCGPCRMIAPLLEDLARELDGKLSVCKVDVDSNSGLAEKFGIQSIPTLLLFKDGQKVKALVGYMAKPDLQKALTEAGIG